ncbi:N-acetyltransferase [Macrococcus hajekii]|nr:GNAT family N-acetyltransferase [Macrococcus hajekii]GGB07983.1 N-acetyltransferase [Macrococcus hajekii]
MNRNQIAHFIHTLNQQPEHRVGYLPRSLSAIEALLNQMSDGDFIIRESSDGTAFLSLIKNESTAHVIGPLTTHPDLKQIQGMWTELTERHPEISSYEFYIDNRHQFGQQAMKALKTQYLGTQYTMTADALSEKIDTRQVIQYQPIYKKSFCELLKNLYIDASEKKRLILDSLDDNHELFILLSEGIVKGYVILEVNPQNICYIDHVETHKHYRQQGIGHKLVAHAATHAFDVHQATQIKLIVEDKRKKSIQFYEKAGFKKTDEMHHFKYTVH